MKKYILMFTIIFILILVLLGIFCIKKDSSKTITVYQSSCKFDDIRNSQAVQIGDLNIQLTDFFLNGQYPEDLENVADSEKKPYSCSQRLKFSSSKNIQAVIYDFIIYDNNGNILTTNLPIVVKSKEYEKRNEILKYINKTRFNSTDMQEYSNRVIGGHIISTIYNTDIPTSNPLVSSVVGIKQEGEYKNDFEEIHILIINPKYQEYGNSEYIELNDTIVEFIIK